MGTYAEVTALDLKAFDIVFDELQRLEKIFSLFDDASELSRLNAAGRIQASEDLYQVLKLSQRYYELTGGAFDVTIAPVSLLWKKAIKSGALPSDEALAQARPLVGFDQVYLEDATRSVRLMRDGMKIDLGGIAKGYAVDQAAARLKEAGIDSALINLGGNMYGLGHARGRGRAWKVGVQDPRREKSILGEADLVDRGISTSGDYEQFFIYQNKRYSHIIDPKTARPAASGIIAATVLASRAATADALSTACVLLGREKAFDLLQPLPDAQATLIGEDGTVWRWPKGLR